jgi:hypothetical protein
LERQEIRGRTEGVLRPGRGKTDGREERQRSKVKGENKAGRHRRREGNAPNPFSCKDAKPAEKTFHGSGEKTLRLRAMRPEF